MKSLILIVFLLGPLTPAFADSFLDVPGLGTLNLTNLVRNAGACDLYDNHGVNRAGVAVRAMWYPSDPVNAWIGAEVALAWDTANGRPSGIGPWLGFRLDTLAAKILGPAPKVGTLTVPDIEFGPMGMYIPTNPDKQRWVYGGALAKHF